MCDPLSLAAGPQPGLPLIFAGVWWGSLCDSAGAVRVPFVVSTHAVAFLI